MKKKKIIIAVIVLLSIIIGLWITGIIPKQIARIVATNYLKNNLPKKQFEYVGIEWNSVFDGYCISFKDENGKEVGFVMNNKYLPIKVGQGKFGIEDSYRIEFEGIRDINDVYNHSASNNYKDLRSLSKDYSIDDAIKDNCFAIGKMIYNDHLYNEFMDKYNKKQNAFIRVAQSTVEGDTIIIDVLYEANNDKIHFVKDNTRDEFSSKNDRIITYKTYEKTGVWNYQNSQYWVVYNGSLPDGQSKEYMLDSNELYVITKIN